MDSLWSRIPATQTSVPTVYAVGDVVFSGAERGTVEAVGGDEYPTISVVWSEGQKAITYPADAPYLRKGMPWE
jgi:thioredoxin reductase